MPVSLNETRISLVLGLLRPDDQLPYSINIFHRFDAVDDEIHRDLLQLHAISDDLRKVGRQFRPHRYVVSHCLVAQKCNRFRNNLIYIKSLLFRGALLELGADPGENIGGALRISSSLVRAARTSSRSGLSRPSFRRQTLALVITPLMG